MKSKSANAEQDVMMEVDQKEAKSRSKSRERPKTLKLTEDSSSLDFADESDSATLTQKLYAQYLGGGQKTPEDIAVSKQSAKSRTASSERPKSVRSMDDYSSSIDVDEPSIKTIKSRTASRERPKSLKVMEDSSSLEFDEPPPARGMKSRTASNERAKQAEQTQVDQPKRGARSRTSSKQEPEHYRGEKTDDVYAKAASKLARQPSNDSRPASRFSDVMSETFGNELTWDEEEDEHMPSLAPMPGLMQPGETRSRQGFLYKWIT